MNFPMLERNAFSTTPLRSGLVPLAPVGPPNFVRLSQACHRLVRQSGGYVLCLRVAQACETRNEGSKLENN